jgi:hypothetical protein
MPYLVPLSSVIDSPERELGDENAGLRDIYFFGNYSVIACAGEAVRRGLYYGCQ